MFTYSYGKYLHEDYGLDASNHDIDSSDPSTGYMPSNTNSKYYTLSEYNYNYTVKSEDNYPYVSYNYGLSDYEGIYNGTNSGFKIYNVESWNYDGQLKTNKCLLNNTINVKCKIKLNKNLLDNVSDGEYYFIKTGNNLYGLYLVKQDGEWYFNNSVKIDLNKFDRYLDVNITLFYDGYNSSNVLRTLITVDDINFYTYSNEVNTSHDIITFYSCDHIYATEIDLQIYNVSAFYREYRNLVLKSKYIYPTGSITLLYKEDSDYNYISYCELTNKVINNDSISYILNVEKYSNNLKEKFIKELNYNTNFPKNYICLISYNEYYMYDTNILTINDSPNILYKYNDNNYYAVMLSDIEPLKYIHVKKNGVTHYAELVNIDDPDASHINVKLIDGTILRLKKFPTESGEIVILDCDFDDGNATDKTENYSFYDNSYGYDVNNNSWFSISDEMEFNDYHYDCNPDFSVPVLEQGSSGSSDSLTNPYQVWILAEGWDNLWIEKGSSDVCRLNKIGDYFIYSTSEDQNYDTFNKFFESRDLSERTKSTLDIETDNNLHLYYGKIIQIAENIDSIEVIGDINA